MIDRYRESTGATSFPHHQRPFATHPQNADEAALALRQTSQARARTPELADRRTMN
jgi:hypothetical protein